MEDVSGKVPIVEHLPTGREPHPNLDNLPEGSAGHPGEHLEHRPIVDGGKTIAVPYKGYGEKVELKDVSEADSWLGRLMRHGRIK